MVITIHYLLERLLFSSDLNISTNSRPIIKRRYYSSSKSAKKIFFRFFSFLFWLKIDLEKRGNPYVTPSDVYISVHSRPILKMSTSKDP